MKKLPILFFVLLPLILSVGCGDHPDWQVDINVPYFNSVTDLPAAHCVALWSNYNGPSASEYVIESSIGGSTPLSLMYSIESAVTN